MSLHLEYRPGEFDEVYGNVETVAACETYCNAVLEGSKTNHSFLLEGPSGCGKTTFARIIASFFGAYDPEKGEEANSDFVELNASDFKGIDTIRNIRSSMRFMPTSGKYRVFFMDECHKLTADAQEAFLKPLEEAPSHVIFILATTNPEKLKITLKRRCQNFLLKPLSEDDIEELLVDVAEAEEKKVPKNIIEHIAANCLGSPGIALKALDGVIDLSPKQMKKQVQVLIDQENKAFDLFKALTNKNTKWATVAALLNDLKDEDEEGIRRMILAAGAGALLKRDWPQAFVVMDAFIEPFYNTGRPGLVHACYEVVNGG